MSTNAPPQGVIVQNPETTIGPPGEQPQAPATKPTEQKPPEGFAPIAALQGEQANTKAARDQIANLKAQAALYGWQVSDDGTMTPPQGQMPQQQAYQPPPIQQAPQGGYTQQVAAQLGISPEHLAGVVAEVAGGLASQYAAPMADGMATLYAQNLRTSDPDWQFYGKDFDVEVKQVPPQYRGHPKALEWARNNAIAKNLPAIKEHWSRTAASNPQTVGRFTEGASPGAGQGSSAQLPPELNEWAADLPAESRARAAERIRKNRAGG